MRRNVKTELAGPRSDCSCGRFHEIAKRLKTNGWHQTDCRGSR